MPLHFEVFDAESGAFSYPDQKFHDLVDEFDAILDAHETGQLSDKPYIAALEQLLVAAPDFVDVYAHIGSHWHRQGKPKKALDAALLGLGIANRHIPEGFNGTIEWGHIENRPYLRAMHIALLSHARLRRHKDAVILVYMMLARNPNDNQGVRYLLGSEAMRAGDHDRARKVFEEEANSYPPYFYELALSHIIKGEWVAAATALRRGFVANTYIAEILGGNYSPEPLAIWHGTSFAEPQAAGDYIQMYGMLWHQHPESKEFARWLFNHPKVMVERAAIMDCKETTLWESDSQKRIALMDKEQKLIDRIDDDLSAAIVTKRKDRRGQTVWPWVRT